MSLLADLFGKAFSALDPREIECKFTYFTLTDLFILDFCIHLVYIIEREVELCLHPQSNFKSLVMDGVLGKFNIRLLKIIVIDIGAGLGLSSTSKINASLNSTEHIFKIEIDEVFVEAEAYLYVQENFEWDLSNPNNSPNEVASQIIADLMTE